MTAAAAETLPSFEEQLQTLPGVGASTARKVASTYASPREVTVLDIDELKEGAGITSAQASAVLSGLAEAAAFVSSPEPPPPAPKEVKGSPGEVLSLQEAETAQRFASEGKDFLVSVAQLRKEMQAAARKKAEEAAKLPPEYIEVRDQIDAFSAITRRVKITPGVCTECGFDYCASQRPPLPPYDDLDEDGQIRVRAAIKKHRELIHPHGGPRAVPVRQLAALG